MDATTAVQTSSQSEQAASELGDIPNRLCASGCFMFDMVSWPTCNGGTVTLQHNNILDCSTCQVGQGGKRGGAGVGGGAGHRPWSKSTSQTSSLELCTCSLARLYSGRNKIIQLLRLCIEIREEWYSLPQIGEQKQPC